MCCGEAVFAFWWVSWCLFFGFLTWEAVVLGWCVAFLHLNIPPKTTNLHT